MKIGVFDSGLGGINVLKELIKNHPNCSYIYYGDSKYLPYGNKSEEQLLDRSIKIVDFFIKQNVDLVITACGTISALIYPKLKDQYNINIINVIDTTIAELNKCGNHNILVLATQATVNSHVFKNNIVDNKVYEQSCPMFVPIIENKSNDSIDYSTESYLKKYKDLNIDDIVLGCTHYPLLEDNIKKYLGYNKKYYNMGTILSSNLSICESNFSLDLYFSLVNSELEQNVRKILNYSDEIKELDLEGE